LIEGLIESSIEGLVEGLIEGLIEGWLIEGFIEGHISKIRDFCSLLNIINTSSAISAGNADLIVPILRRKAFKLAKVI